MDNNPLETQVSKKEQKDNDKKVRDLKKSICDSAQSDFENARIFHVVEVRRFVQQIKTIDDEYSMKLDSLQFQDGIKIQSLQKTCEELLAERTQMIPEYLRKIESAHKNFKYYDEQIKKELNYFQWLYLLVHTSKSVRFILMGAHYCGGDYSEDSTEFILSKPQITNGTLSLYVSHSDHGYIELGFDVPHEPYKYKLKYDRIIFKNFVDAMKDYRQNKNDYAFMHYYNDDSEDYDDNSHDYPWDQPFWVFDGFLAHAWNSKELASYCREQNITSWGLAYKCQLHINSTPLHKIYHKVCRYGVACNIFAEKHLTYYYHGTL